MYVLSFQSPQCLHLANISSSGLATFLSLFALCIFSSSLAKWSLSLSSVEEPVPRPVPDVSAEVSSAEARAADWMTVDTVDLAYPGTEYPRDHEVLEDPVALDTTDLLLLANPFSLLQTFVTRLSMRIAVSEIEVSAESKLFLYYWVVSFVT